MLVVAEVIEFKDDAVTYKFSDGSVGTHHTVRRGRFLEAGPLDTLNTAQLLAVAKFNEQAKKPSGGWL